MKASGTVDAIGKIVTWILVVLLVLGLAGGAAYLAMKGSGASFYAEMGGERIFGGTERELTFSTGQTYDFSVRALEGGEINYSVKVTANPENNFDFVLDGKTYRFSGEDEERNDYSEVFALTRRADGFSLTIPEGSVEKAVKAKFGEGVQIGTELSAELAYFSVTIGAGESRAQIFFRFSPELLAVELDCESIVF